MQQTVNIPADVELIIYSKDITKDGKSFTVYETLDNHKNRVTVTFTQTGLKPPAKSEFPIKVKCVNGVDVWQDKRKRYPVYRISNYTLLSTKVGAKNRGIPVD